MSIMLQALLCLAPAAGAVLVLVGYWHRSAARDRIAEVQRPGYVGTDFTAPGRCFHGYLELTPAEEEDIRAAHRGDC